MKRVLSIIISFLSICCSNPENTPDDLSYFIGGQGPAGGFIIFDKGNYSDGWRYIESSPIDISTSMYWYNFLYMSIPTGASVGSGRENTIEIVNRQGEVTGAGIDYAASCCMKYSINGYEDWYLPSIDELDLMYNNLKLKNIGSFNGERYWSSTDYSSDSMYAWVVNFINYEKHGSGKNKYYYVRAVRYF